MSGRGQTAAEALAPMIAAREEALGRFAATHAERIALCCEEMASRFAAGGALHAQGQGAAATDAAHVAVEFMHPVIVGKRAFPAVVVGGGSTATRASGDAGIALVISHAAAGATMHQFLESGRRNGMATIAMLGANGHAEADFLFSVPSEDRSIVQEVHETAYHLLWELVHLFAENAAAGPEPGTQACITCGDTAVPVTVIEARGATALVERGGSRGEVATDLVSDAGPGDTLLCHAGVALERIESATGDAGADPTDPGFLYPFLGGGGAGREALIAEARASVARKGADAIGMRRMIDLDAIGAAAGEIRERLARGGRLMAFGNGGSSTDAQDLAADLGARGWRALSLTDDVATVTAVANDVGFESVFSRQLIALAEERDVAVGISTSGASANVLAGLREARERGLLTCAISGYGGGSLQAADAPDHLLSVPGDYVPRIQEAQATVYHLLVEVIGEAA